MICHFLSLGRHDLPLSLTAAAVHESTNHICAVFPSRHNVTEHRSFLRSAGRGTSEPDPSPGRHQDTNMSAASSIFSPSMSPEHMQRQRAHHWAQSSASASLPAPPAFYQNVPKMAGKGMCGSCCAEPSRNPRCSLRLDLLSALPLSIVLRSRPWFRANA